MSGAVAVVRARFPDLDAANVINRLITTADDKGPAGRDPQYGFGALDIVGALTEDVPTVSANPLGSLTDTATPRPPDSTADDSADGGLLDPLTSGGVLVAVLGVGSLACFVGFIALVAWLINRLSSGRNTPPPPPPIR